MKVPNWLYFVLVIAGIGGLALFLTLLFLFLYISAYDGRASSDVFLTFFIIIVYLPSFISLPLGYVLVSRKIKSPSQRRILNGITVALTGAIMLLAGTAVAFSGTGFSNLFETFFGLPAIFLGSGVVLVGFSLAFSDKTANGLIRDGLTQSAPLDQPNPEMRGYLPMAGIAALIATILTALVSVFTVLTALSPCYTSPIACNPTVLITFGVLSTLGIATGSAATSTLLMGRYRRTVPLGLISLAITPLLIFFVWGDLLLLAIPIIGLCAVSMVLTGWHQKDTLKASIWGAIGVLSASLGAIALVSGDVQFSRDASTTCRGVWIRPFFGNAEFLWSLAASCMIVVLISGDFAWATRVKSSGFPPSKMKKIGRSKLLEILTIVLVLSIVSTSFFAGYAAGYLGQCRGFCYTEVEQLNVLQAISAPSSGQITFTLANSGTSDIIITQVQVQGGAIGNPTNASQLSISKICAGSSNIILVASFPGITFVKGTTYGFRITSIQGHTFPYTFTA